MSQSIKIEVIEEKAFEMLTEMEKDHLIKIYQIPKKKAKQSDFRGKLGMNHKELSEYHQFIRKVRGEWD